MKKILALCFLVACSHADASKASAEAKAFSANIPGVTSVVCNDTDSDKDGYVSCTLFRGEKEPIAISCGAERWCITNCASGCKLTPARVPTRSE